MMVRVKVGEEEKESWVRRCEDQGRDRRVRYRGAIRHCLNRSARSIFDANLESAAKREAEEERSTLRGSIRLRQMFRMKLFPRRCVKLRDICCLLDITQT